VPVHYPPDALGAVRTCERCFQSRSLTEFRRRERGNQARMRQCRRCHNAAERHRRAALRGSKARRRTAKQLAAIRDAVSAGRVQALVAEMVRRAGGMEHFANTWVACFRRDLEKGGLAALRHFEATIRLMQHCEQHPPDVGRMTDA
jgi:hypothetical protein